MFVVCFLEKVGKAVFRWLYGIVEFAGKSEQGKWERVGFAEEKGEARLKQLKDLRSSGPGLFATGKREVLIYVEIWWSKLTALVLVHWKKDVTKPEKFLTSAFV